MLQKTKSDCEASSWAEVFEAELPHLLIWSRHKCSRRNASPSSHLPVCLRWLQATQEHFSSMHCTLYVLPTVLVLGSLGLCSFSWALQAVSRLDKQPEVHRYGGHYPLHSLAMLQESYWATGPTPPTGTVQEPALNYEQEAVDWDIAIYCIQTKLLCLYAVMHETGRWRYTYAMGGF